MKSTKIVCTIGPASEKYSKLKKMLGNGMNAARLNFSHGNYDEYSVIIKRLRRLERESGKAVAVIQDLQGPKIRVGNLPKEGVKLVSGKKVVFDYKTKEYKDKEIPIDYPLHKYVKKNNKMLLNDGRIEVKVLSVSGSEVNCKVKTGGLLTAHKGINIPDTLFSFASITEKDKKDVYFGVKNKVDFIALSFVNNAKDIKILRKLIDKYSKQLKIKEKESIRIIAKIERREAVKNIDEIIDVADCIMVARGDLGIEIPIQKVPLVQKNIITKCIEKEKPVIVATQMLESMTESPNPTRAEVSDVANAVIDNADAVMLSDETAVGKYPDRTVKVMGDIIKETEKSEYDNKVVKKYNNLNHDVDDILSSLSRLLASGIGAKLILSASRSGDTGRFISSYRPSVPVVIMARTDRVRRQLNISWGITPFNFFKFKSIEEMAKKSIGLLKKKKMVKKTDKIIIVAGEPIGEVGHVNLLEVKDI